MRESRPWVAALGVAWACGASAAAEDPPLICFGNEPSWSLSLEEPGSARLSLPDEPELVFHGKSARIDVLRESVWRGRRAGVERSDLVAFLREAACSDGMSDATHPFEARVSLPDGRFLAGCCRVPTVEAGATGAATPPAPAPALEGRVWRLSGLRGEDELAALREPVTLRFEAGRVQGFGGCNQLAGSYRVEGERVHFGPLAGTMMACPEPAMRIESKLLRALQGELRFEVVRGRLLLAAASEEGPTLVFDPAPAPRLEGIAWEVSGFNNGRHAVVSPLVGTALTLSFQDGTIVGNAGCNGFRTSYTVEGGKLAVGPAAATRKHCDGEGIMEQEREFLAALESATTWAIERGMLDLHRADGERVLLAHEGGTR